MKKMIAYGTDKWAKHLLTVARLEKIAYFVDNDDNTKFSWGGTKPVYPVEQLRQENPEDIIVIITNSKKYDEASRILQNIGLKENVHYFNGWKLDGNFYDVAGDNQDWMLDESMNPGVFSNDIWEKRAEIMSSMIPDDVGSIMDIGCGDCKLKKYLPKKIQYYGLDYCAREGGAFVCNFNEESLPQVKVDMYYLAGVLPYAKDIPGLLHQMERARYILMSVYALDPFIRLDGYETDVPHFVFQNFSIDEIVNCLYGLGFALAKCKYDYKIMDVHFLLFKKMGC